MVLGYECIGSTAAAADDINEAAVHELTHLLAHLFGRHVIGAEGIGQSGVRMHCNIIRCFRRQLLKEGFYLLWSEGAVEAYGEYVGMVETDDWIELNTFESLWTTANKQDVDIVAANQYLYHTKPEVYNHPFENLSKCPYERVFCPRDVLQSFAVKPLIWSAIYRRSMLKENGIRFNETPGASFQDISFHFMVMTVAKTAFFLDRYFYHYRSDSETQSVHSDGKVYCMCDEARYYEQFLEHRPADKLRLLKPFVTWIYDKYFWNFIRIAPCFQWEFLMQFRKELLRYRQAGLLNESPSNTSGYNTFRKGFHEIIDNPVDFYKKYCKKYCTCPTAEKLPTPKLIRESRTETPDISIIIPLCNEENRIAVSLESAQKQTLENIEIVCVDDGSDDATLKKVMERAEADSRFTVLHQDNRGSGSAKNRGLEYARGKYVLFLYGGDRLREDAAERLVFLADKNGLAIINSDNSLTFRHFFYATFTPSIMPSIRAFVFLRAYYSYYSYYSYW